MSSPLPPPAPAKGPPRERWLTPEEARRLMDATPSDHIKDYILLSLHTLARPRAIFDLTVYQVNLERRIIDFLPPGQRQSNKRRPVVPISNALMPMLKRRIEESESGYIIEYEGRPILGNLRIGFRRAVGRLKRTLWHLYRACVGLNMGQLCSTYGNTNTYVS